MRPFISEIIQLSPEEDLFFYFTLNSQHIETTTKLSINIQHIQFFNPEPEFYFMSNNNVVLDSNSPYLPMPIKDKKQKDLNEVRNTKISPAIQEGIYIIKFPKGVSKHPIKLQFSLNNDQILDPNGIFQNILPFSEATHKFKVHIPEAGEFRIILDKCSKVSISSIYFVTMEGQREEISQNENFAQAYPYIYLDEASNDSFQKKKLVVPIQRGKLKTNGLLCFELENLERID